MTRTKHLKVMVDEDIFSPRVMNALHRIGAVDAKPIDECGLRSGTKDPPIIAATTEKRRLLLTANYRNINERWYPPCTHGGIILIDHPRPSDAVIYERVRAFCQSGQRSEAKGHVTYLKADGYTIYKLHKEKIEARY